MIGCFPRSLSHAFFAVLLLSSASVARAERKVSAFDPRLHVRPPTMRGLDGGAAELVLDADFLERARRYRAGHPAALPPAAGISSAGEVLIVQGDDQILVTDGTGFGLRPE